MYYVYIIQNKINLKIYVGKTNNPILRLKKHLNIVKQGKTIGRKTLKQQAPIFEKQQIVKFNLSNKNKVLDKIKIYLLVG